MWIRIKGWLQRAWAAKSREERTAIYARLLQSLVAGVLSLATMASSLELGKLLNIVQEQYYPLIADAIANNWSGLLTSLISASWFCWALHSMIRKMLNRNLEFYEKPVKRDGIVKCSQDYVDCGYQIWSLGPPGSGAEAAVSRDINTALRQLKAWAFSKKAGTWKLSGDGAALLRYAVYRPADKGQICFDADKVRLGTDILLSNGSLRNAVTVQKTRYFSGLATNELSFVKVEERYDSDLRTPLRIAYDGLSLFLEPAECGAQRTLHSLEGSFCSNHVGVSTMAITKNKSVIISCHSSRNIQSPNCLVPSGSGSIDWKDLGSDKDFLQSICRAAERELREECGFKGGLYSMHTVVTGFARLIHRGGKPEFFCLTRIDESDSDLSLEHSHQERQFIASNLSNTLYERIDLSKEEIQESVKTFCEARRDEISISLELALKFMADAIEHEH